MISLVIPVATRSGTFGPVSASVPAGLSRLSVVTNTESLFDAGDSIDVLLEVSFDNQATWKHELSATGMRANPAAVPPEHCGCAVSFGDPGQPYPSHMRVTATHHGTVRYGAAVTVD